MLSEITDALTLEKLEDIELDWDDDSLVEEMDTTLEDLAELFFVVEGPRFIHARQPRAKARTSLKIISQICRTQVFGK